MNNRIETDVGIDHHTRYYQGEHTYLKVLTYGDDEPLFRINDGVHIVLTRKQSKHLRRLLKADHRDYRAYKADLDR